MCVPAALVGAAISVIGTGFSAITASQQARYQAKIAERNAGMEREAARQEIENTREAALQHYRRVAQLKDEQIVGAAANGVGVDFGTAGDVQADTDMMAAEDARRIYQQGNENLKSHDMRAANFSAEASAQRAAASNALVSGAFDVGSSVLTAAQQYSRLRQGMGTNRRLDSSVKRTIKANPGIF